jgi:hypothetical protein
MYKYTGIIYNVPELKNYILTPEDFLSRKDGKWNFQYQNK